MQGPGLGARWPTGLRQKLRPSPIWSSPGSGRETRSPSSATATSSTSWRPSPVATPTDLLATAVICGPRNRVGCCSEITSFVRGLWFTGDMASEDRVEGWQMPRRPLLSSGYARRAAGGTSVFRVPPLLREPAFTDPAQRQGEAPYAAALWFAWHARARAHRHPPRHRGRRRPWRHHGPCATRSPAPRSSG
jgi:hypothetical protein